MSQRQQRQTSLRPEARAFPWSSMSPSQQDALRSMTNMLRAAVERFGQSQESTVDEHRSNRSLLLSGGRGTGKTSLLLTLREAMISRAGFQIEDSETRANIEALKGKIIWLHTLDMEPLPHPTNLLVAILARVEKALEKIGSAPRDYGLLATSSDIEKKLLDLQRLTTDASLAWDGNVKERAASLDPDSYASEVLRAEKARIRVDIDFPSLLRDLASSANPGNDFAPLFVLPVDDFDLSPVRCLELLRLLRAVSAPNLFTIVLGDIDVAEFAFDLKLAGDLAKVAGISLSTRDVIDTDFARRSADISRSAMRKLLPPGQRLLLNPYTIQEALALRTYGSETDLEDLIHRCKLDLNIRPLNELNHRKLSFTDLLLGSDFNLRTQSRSASAILQSPARQLVDFYMFLNSKQKIETSDLIDHLLNWSKEVINGDSRLSAAVCRTIHDELSQSVRSGKFASSVLDVHVMPLNRPLHSSKNTEGLPVHYEFSQVEKIELVAGYRDGDTGRQETLQDRTAGFLFLIHDLLRLSSGLGAGSRFAIPSASSLQLGNTFWQIGTDRFNVPWLGFSTRSFWEIEQFLDAWHFYLHHPLSSDSSKNIKDLSFGWLNLCLLNSLFIDHEKLLFHRGHFSEMREEAMMRIQHFVNLLESSEDATIEDVFIQLAVLCSCETCLPREAVFWLWDTPVIRSKWQSLSYQIKIRRLSNLNLTTSNFDYLKFALVNPRAVINELDQALSSDLSHPLRVALREFTASLDLQDQKYESIHKRRKIQAVSSVTRSSLDDFLNEEDNQRYRSVLRCLLEQPEVLRFAMKHPSNSDADELFCPVISDLPG